MTPKPQKYDWLRLWHDMPTDPKMRTISRKSGASLAEVLSVFVLMLTNASSAAERGTLENWDDEDAAAGLDMETETVTAIREAMQGKTLDGDRLTGWEKRQPKREEDGASTQRSREFRARKRDASNADETQGNADATQCNATPRAREEKIREDNSLSDDRLTSSADAGMRRGIEPQVESVVKSSESKRSSAKSGTPPVHVQIESILAECDADPDRAHFRACLGRVGESGFDEHGTVIKSVSSYRLVTLRNWCQGDGAPPPPCSEDSLTLAPCPAGTSSARPGRRRTATEERIRETEDRLAVARPHLAAATLAKYSDASRSNDLALENLK